MSFPQAYRLNILPGSKRIEANKSMKIRSTKNNLSNHSKVTTHEELKVPKEKALLCISIGHQELLVFQDKTLEKV